MKLLLHSPVISIYKRLIYSAFPKTPALVKDAINLWEDIFRENKISEPNNSIQIIMHSVLGAKNVVEVQTHLEKELNIIQRKQLDEYCLKRLTRMPLQYIIEEWDFRELTLAMRGPVFIPRPETEQLVDIILEEQNNKSPKSIVEIGCGSGAVSIALAKTFTQADIIAVDASQDACALTIENCKRFEFSEKVQMINTKLLQNGTFENGMQLENVDILVSNPPYIKTDDISTLQPEITLYEDLRALDGGKDGLETIEGLLLLAEKALRGVNGKLFMEIDASLVRPIQIWLTNHNRTEHAMGLRLSNVYKDLYQVERFVSIAKDGE